MAALLIDMVEPKPGPHQNYLFPQYKSAYCDIAGSGLSQFVGLDIFILYIYIYVIIYIYEIDYDFPVLFADAQFPWVITWVNNDRLLADACITYF